MSLGNLRQKPPAFDRLAKAEAASSRHINILGHYDDSTLIDKTGKLIKIFTLAGINFVTQSDLALDTLKNRRNTFLKSFNSEYALYFWTVRRKTAEFPNGEFTNPFARHVNKKYKAKIVQTEMYHSTLYMAVVTKPPEGVINKGFNLFKQLSHAFDKASKEAYLAKRHKALNDITKKLLSAFSDYHITLLSTYTKNAIRFSEPLEFISQLINFEKTSVPLQLGDASTYLPNKRLFFNRRSGTIEIRHADMTKQFAAVLSIKEYEAATYAGMLDELNNLRMEYIITQSYRFYDRHQAKQKVRGQQQDLAQSKDESISQTEEISVSFDEIAGGEVGYGRHHFTLICYAKTQEQLNQHVGDIVAAFADMDMQCVREDVVCECGFWAQLPGNFAYIARDADISTRNMAAFASLHNYATGNINGNYWGDAVTVFETLSGSPYYFNFHYKDVGNFLVFGITGSGKTVLVGFLILQSLKFGGKRIIFDKDRGLEILVRALGGIYEIIKPGLKTGFNPCQLADTLENRKFLTTLFKKMLSGFGQMLTESDLQTIENAIHGLYRLDQAERQFSHIASFFGAKQPGSLRARFDQWHSEGAHAWLFDNPQDTLNLQADVIGFDLGHILNDEDCKTPALMYLTHRIGQHIEGQRAMLFCDEGWRALSDEYFKELFNDWSRTPRKKNNFLGLATQSPGDTVKFAISETLNEAAACKIFFPNPTAKRDVYMGELGLSEQEYELVKTLPDKENYFLLNYGRGAESIVIRANLEGLDDEIAVISARESTINTNPKKFNYN